MPNPPGAETHDLDRPGVAKWLLLALVFGSLIVLSTLALAVAAAARRAGLSPTATTANEVELELTRSR